MFGHHHHQGRHGGRHNGHHGPHGRHALGDRHEGHQGRGRRDRGGRLFNQDDLRLLVLKLVADKPSHGYELIGAVQALAGGAYAPSPDAIYPTLTLLHELGYLSATSEDGKTLYTLTDEGQAFLISQESLVQGLFERMSRIAALGAVFSPQLRQAREALKAAVRRKLTDGVSNPEKVAAIAKALDEAAAVIDGI